MGDVMGEFVLIEPRAPAKAKPRRGGWSWGPVERVKLRTLSLGAGVQSTTLALMAIKGEIGPLPDAAIFADTGDETPSTMRHLQWLEGEITRQTNGRMRCLRVSRGERLSDRIRRRAEGHSKENRFVGAPFFAGNGGRGKRQCRLCRATPGMREFVHRSLKPLDEVDFSTAEDRGQGSMLDICEGGCGV